MIFPNISKQNRDMKSSARCPPSDSSQIPSLDTGVLGFDFMTKGSEFRFGARDENNVESFRRELAGESLPNTIRGAGDECQRPSWPKFVQL